MGKHGLEYVYGTGLSRYIYKNKYPRAFFSYAFSTVVLFCSMFLCGKNAFNSAEK